MLKIGDKVTRTIDDKKGFVEHTDFVCSTVFCFHVNYSDEIRWEKASDLRKENEK